MATFSPPSVTNYPQTKFPLGLFRIRTKSSFPLLANNLNRRCRNPRLFLCQASISPQPPPPGGKDPVRLKGATSALARFQDRVQIFFAVLFWISLFFWASAWDRKNKGPGRSNRGFWFRR